MRQLGQELIYIYHQSRKRLYLILLFQQNRLWRHCPGRCFHWQCTDAAAKIDAVKGGNRSGFVPESIHWHRKSRKQRLASGS